MAYRRSWQRDFERSIREHPDWPVVVSQGDSWFSYPHEKNVVDFLDEPAAGGREGGTTAEPGAAPSQRDWSLLRLERNEDEILAVMAAPDCLVEKRFTRRLRQVEDCYCELIDIVLDDGADLKVLVNSYDAPLSSGEHAKLLGGRNPGPWLRPAFAANGYPAGSALEREIAGLVLERFCAMLDRISNEVPTRFHRVETRGAVGAEWADEIHPNARGAQAVAQRFEMQLQRLGLVQVAPPQPVPLRAVRKAS